MLLGLWPFRETQAQDTQPPPPWKLSGYYLNLFTRSKTIIPEGERFSLDLSRMRLKLDGEPVKHVTFQLQYDHEILLGGYLKTRQFALTKAGVPDATFDLERTYVDRRSVLVRHKLYRATVSWSGNDIDVTLGRQRIAWGTGRFWSPLDILNPFDAVRLERDERAGVDAALIERRTGPIGKVSAVFAPATRNASAAVAGYLHGNARGTDYSAVVGRFRGERVIGGDFSTRRGGLGIRGEATATRAQTGRHFLRALLGTDYGFPSTLTLTAELYYNGQGTSDPDGYDFPALFEGRIRSVARHYGGAAASYEITPLMKVLVYAVFNADDRSRLLWPALEYSVASNVALIGGIQHFSGSGGSEYARFPDVLHAQAKLFF